ncbi:MAG: EAL domain-containing protein [Candidatus Nanopelagicales bacterium]|nr:EAL domain-containing protein [Candidatus Nanopelagicales bacterium]
MGDAARPEAVPPTPSGEEWLRASLDTLQESLFIFTAVRDESGDVIDLQYRFLNSAAQRLYSRTSDEVIGRGLIELFPSVKDLGIFDCYITPMATGQSCSMVVQGFHDGGVVGDFIVNAVPFGDGVVVTAHNVTEEAAAQRALAESESLLRVILDSTSDAIMRFGPDLRVRYVNRQLIKNSGISLQGWLGKTFAEAGYPANLAAGWDEHSRHVFATGESVQHEFEIDLPGGHHWFETRVDPEFDTDGAVSHVITASRDVTARKIAESRLRQSEALLEVAVEGSHDGTATYGPDLRFEYVNQRTVELSGMPKSAWIGKTMEELGFPPDSVAFWTEHVARVFATGVAGTMRYDLENTEGHRWYEAILAPQLDESGAVAHVVSTNHDITDWVLAESALREMATHDSLTNLANRRAVLDEIQRGLTAAQRTRLSVAVLVIDLDRFKYYNDSLGHAAGDVLLQHAGARLAEAVRGGDLVGRLGGDEFVVVMRDLSDAAEAARTAWRIVEAFRQPFDDDDAEHIATASVGVAYSDSEGAAADLLRDADTAMFAAKDAGRDQVAIFNSVLREAVAQRLEMEDALRHALERDQLAVWYQPEVDLATGEIVAAEALLRWHHPSGRVLTAGSFIDIAEETGLIHEIGAWVLEQACAVAAEWSSDHSRRHLTMRVNVSARQLGEGRLLEDIDQALGRTGLDPTRLCLEITETTLLDDSVLATQSLMGIRARGMSIAIDDFGTGYAPLTYLQRYPIDVLKIDRSFVTRVATDAFDRQLIGALMSLADYLDLDVTAEGVETDEQAITLRALRCTSAQGFLYSEAVPADQLHAMAQTVFPHGGH